MESSLEVSGLENWIELNWYKLYWIDSHSHFIICLVHAIRQGSGCRFIDNTQHIETSNLTRILCGLTLWVIEIGRNCDDGILHTCVEECLCCLLHFYQSEGSYLTGGVYLLIWTCEGREKLKSTIHSHSKTEFFHCCCEYQCNWLSWFLCNNPTVL